MNVDESKVSAQAVESILEDLALRRGPLGRAWDGLDEDERQGLREAFESHVENAIAKARAEVLHNPPYTGGVMTPDRWELEMWEWRMASVAESHNARGRLRTHDAALRAALAERTQAAAMACEQDGCGVCPGCMEAAEHNGSAT